MGSLVICWLFGFMTSFEQLLRITHCYFLKKKKKKVVRIFSRQYSISEHASTSVLIVRQKKKNQRKIPEHLIPFCKSPCGTLHSDPAPPPTHFSTPWWEIIFCLGSRLFSSRCAKVTDLYFSSWWQQCAHWLLRIAAVCTLHCSNLQTCLRDLEEKCLSEYLRLCSTICCLISTPWYAGFPRRLS